MVWACCNFSLSIFGLLSWFWKLRFSSAMQSSATTKSLFFNWICSFIKTIFALRLWTSLSLFSSECAACPNLHFAFKSLSYLCLANFSEDSSCLFIETFIIPPTLALSSFTILRAMISSSLLEFPCMPGRYLLTENPLSGTLFPLLILSTQLAKLNSWGYFNWPESFLIASIFLQYTSMHCYFGTFDGILRSISLKTFSQ